MFDKIPFRAQLKKLCFTRFETQFFYKLSHLSLRVQKFFCVIITTELININVHRIHYFRTYQPLAILFSPCFCFGTVSILWRISWKFQGESQPISSILDSFIMNIRFYYLEVRGWVLHLRRVLTNVHYLPGFPGFSTAFLRRLWLCEVFHIVFPKSQRLH